MFKNEMLGYNKSEVQAYLDKLLNKIEEYEIIIENQQETIRGLEQRLELSASSGNSEEQLEKAKKMSDEILEYTLNRANRIEERIREIILEESTRK